MTEDDIASNRKEAFCSKTLWNAVHLSPRKTHTIFLDATYNVVKLRPGKKMKIHT